ncbi:MAG: pyruvate formate lyase-activating protein [Spirochaetales bacterium]|nr:MAG: pyruvate formate lyase-activating protein [Spirochaetales bacterium]
MISKNRVLVFDIKRYALHDGPGIRTTAFLKGCPLACVWCQNPEGINFERTLWNYGGSLHWDSHDYSPEELAEELLRDEVFYKTSGGGVTLSGGEPLVHAHFVKEVFRLCKLRNAHTALETTLYAAQKTVTDVLPLVDLIMADLKLLDGDNHKKYTGVDNKIILENLKYVASTGQDLLVRLPLIPGITDSRENVTGVSQFVADLPGNISLELLNFNPLAESKYRALGLPYRFSDTFSALPAEKFEELQHLAGKSGCRILPLDA